MSSLFISTPDCHSSEEFFLGVAFKVGVEWCHNYRTDVRKSELAVEMQSGFKTGKVGLADGNESEEPSAEERKSKIMRTGIITAVSIALHNFPEGLVAFLAAVADWEVGVVTAFAIAA